MFATLALAALLLEAAVGYPDAIYRRIGHPVTWLGALIARCDTALNRAATAPASRRLAGVACTAAIVAVALLAGLAATAVAASLAVPALEIAILAILASTLIAQRSLHNHVAAVATALETASLDAGRDAVSRIVGRDPQTLDEPAVCRAAIESLAENFSDGVVAPVFWITVAGLPGGLAYKAINTGDSMIGHRTERHRVFGWATARLDDLVNLPASRLAALWLIVAAAVIPSAHARTALKAVRADARKHTSPNAGWPESAMAGALGLRLAGPRTYAGTIVEAAWMGSGRADATTSDVRLALQLYRVACALQVCALAALALALACTY